MKTYDNDHPVAYNRMTSAKYIRVEPYSSTHVFVWGEYHFVSAKCYPRPVWRNFKNKVPIKSIVMLDGSEPPTANHYYHDCDDFIIANLPPNILRGLKDYTDSTYYGFITELAKFVERKVGEKV